MSGASVEPEADISRSLVLIRAGNPKAALEAFAAAGRALEGLKGRAGALEAGGRPDEALACLDLAIHLDPGDATALSHKGDLLTRLNRFDEAADQYREATRFDPEGAAHHAGLGLALRLGRRLEPALAAYDRALELDEDDPWTWAEKADVLIELQRFPEAFECLEKATSLPGGLTGGEWGIRGQALARHGANDEAIRCFRRALDLNETDAWSLSGLAKALQAKGDIEGALGCFDQVLELEPGEKRWSIEKGDALVEAGRLDEALVDGI